MMSAFATYIGVHAISNFMIHPLVLLVRTSLSFARAASINDRRSRARACRVINSVPYIFFKWIASERYSCPYGAIVPLFISFDMVRGSCLTINGRSSVRGKIKM